MLTPQAIKDQEFQVKFRGYDAIEVKAYLELLAEDFFEITEQNRTKTEEIEALQAEHEALLREKEVLASEVQANQENAAGIQSEIQVGYEHKDREINELREETDKLKATVSTLEKENAEYIEKISALEEKIEQEAGSSQTDSAELEKLRAKVEMLEERNNELKQEGLDFKTTILAAQKFADNLRETTQEEARKMLEDAKEEVEKFRTDAEAELARLPKEIEDLSKRKSQVREELRLVLQSYLDSLDAFPEMEGVGSDDDLSDLFESIEIPEGGPVDPDELDKIASELE